MSELSQLNSHLEELRRRIIKIVLAIGGITIFLLTFHAVSFEILGHYSILSISRAVE